MRGSSARALDREEELGALGAEEVAVVVGRRRKSREMVGGGRGSGSGAASVGLMLKTREGERLAAGLDPEGDLVKWRRLLHDGMEWMDWTGRG